MRDRNRSRSGFENEHQHSPDMVGKENGYAPHGDCAPGHKDAREGNVAGEVGESAAVPAPSPVCDDNSLTLPMTPKSSVCDDLQIPRPYLEIDTNENDDEVRDGLVLPTREISLDMSSMSPVSCKSTKSTGSSSEFNQPNQTIIIFDWDDTLCPSTACMRTHGLSVLGGPPEGELKQGLEDLAAEVKLVIEQASELAKVVIVTNAEEGWVELSCKAWLPSLQSTLAVCEVASARSTWEPRGVKSPAGWKARTFEDEIDRFYSRYAHQSWKNIISVGDAPHEREALSRVVRWAPSSGKKCRPKSVKFVLRPTIMQLIRQLQMLRESLKEIVLHDDDLDLHFSAESLTEPLISPTSQQC